VQSGDHRQAQAAACAFSPARRRNYSRPPRFYTSALTSPLPRVILDGKSDAGRYVAAILVARSSKMKPLKSLFSSSCFMPHAYCYTRNQGFILLHVISDLSIALANLTIPITLCTC
jgi:hypothetical protein